MPFFGGGGGTGAGLMAAAAGAMTYEQILALQERMGSVPVRTAPGAVAALPRRTLAADLANEDDPTEPVRCAICMDAMVRTRTRNGLRGEHAVFVSRDVRYCRREGALRLIQLRVHSPRAPLIVCACVFSEHRRQVRRSSRSAAATSTTWSGAGNM